FLPDCRSTGRGAARPAEKQPPPSPLLFLRRRLFEPLERRLYTLLRIPVDQRGQGGLETGDGELARERELERLHGPAAHLGPLVVQVRGDQIERMGAAACRERGEHVSGEAVRAE